MNIGDRVKWTSQSNGSKTEKSGIITGIVKEGEVPIQVANAQFPHHKKMFDGLSIPPSEDGQAYLVEVIVSQLAKPRFYMPRPRSLEKFQ